MVPVGCNVSVPWWAGTAHVALGFRAGGDRLTAGAMSGERCSAPARYDGP